MMPKYHLMTAIQASFCLAAASAAEPVRVVGNDMPGARQPQVTIDGDGHIHVAFGSGDSIYYCRSDDGASFERPTQIPTRGKLSLGMRRGPRVAAPGDAIVVTAVLGERGGGKDGDVLAWRSDDAGMTWSGPTKVNDVPGSAREGLHALASGPQGQSFCAWLDLRNGKTEVFGAGSDDGGATWSKNALVYHSPSGSVCECCHPSVAYDGDGGLYVMWRNSLDGNRDMYLATSKDNGQTFAKARKLGTGAWPLDACPMDGGAVAVGGKGKVTSIWRRATEVYTLGTGRKEQPLGRGEQPWCAADATGAYLVWLSRRPGDLWLKAPGARQPEKIAGNANDPVVAVAPSGSAGPAVVVWEGDAGGIQALVVPHD
jgi:hypothetical protein